MKWTCGHWKVNYFNTQTEVHKRRKWSFTKKSSAAISSGSREKWPPRVIWCPCVCTKIPSTPHALCPFLSKVISCMWQITLPHMHKKLASSPYPVLGAFYHLIMLTLCWICHPPEILHGFTAYPKGPFFLDSLRHRESSPCIVKSRSPYVAYTLKPSRWTFSLLASFLLLSMFSLLTSLATRSFSWCPCWRVRLPRVGRSGGLGFWLGFFASRHCSPSIMLSLFLTSFYAHCTGLPWVVSAGVWYAAPRPFPDGASYSIYPGPSTDLAVMVPMNRALHYIQIHLNFFSTVNLFMIVWQVQNIFGITKYKWQ